ncbi:MAG: aromatic ring-hydroxylating dioxygenase subunit alpha [Sphingomonadales bacterium]|nr:MAG: aromatic ring-hydroxylating dioxygenase subunit alpha [Sphingomonadales bacterium]
MATTLERPQAAADERDAGEAARLAAVPLRVTDPERIPSKRYYDQAFFELEREKLWPHVWQMAARLEEIPEIGDYVEYRNLDKSVIVVRTKAGVKAFHNACRHRGVQLVPNEGRGNCRTKGFICPFHGWRWNMDGDNTFVFGKQIFSEELLAKAEIDLVPARVEEWGGCAFINFDENAPALIDSLGPVAQKLGDRNVDKLRMEWWYATVLPTNWKLAMEAFMEGYHVMRTHPQLHLPEFNAYGPDPDSKPITSALTPRDFITKYHKFFATNSRGMAGMVLQSEVDIAAKSLDMELPDDLGEAMAAYNYKIKDDIYKEGLAKGLPVFDINAADARNGLTYVEFMFPHYFLLPYFSAMSSYRIRPLTAETCFFEIWSLAPMADDDPRPRVTEPTILPYDSTDFPEIPQQDYANLPIQQQGLHAGGFDFMRLSREKEGMISNYQRLIDGYLADVEPQKLARATAVVNSGFDAAIADIGF